MNDRPKLTNELDGSTFGQYYYLKDELVHFCKTNGLSSVGSKRELSERITVFLDTGEKLVPPKKIHITATPQDLSLSTVIESNFVCSERHRAFFIAQIGDSFSFNVPFQKWLKANAGKTYGDAVAAYRQIKNDSKKTKPVIDAQFEYNTYIRDFFADNNGKTLQDAIQCWRYKKSLNGHNRYEKSDLIALK